MKGELFISMKFNRSSRIIFPAVIALSLASSVVINAKNSRVENPTGAIIESLSVDSIVDSIQVPQPKVIGRERVIEFNLLERHMESSPMYCSVYKVNERSNPSTDSDILGYYTYGQEVDVFYIDEDGWARVDNDGMTYVKAEYLVSDLPDIPHYSLTDYNGKSYQLSYELQDFTYKMCMKYDIEDYYQLILAQMFKESRYDTTIYPLISPTNDWGLMQINEGNFRKLNRVLGITDFADHYNSIECGVYMMAVALNRDHLTVDQALSRYNTGTSYDSTDYSRAVQQYMERMELINE